MSPADRPAVEPANEDCEAIHVKGMPSIGRFDPLPAAPRVSHSVKSNEFRTSGCRNLGAGCRPLVRAPVIAKLTKAQQDRLDQTWQQLVGSSKRDCTLRFFDFVVHYDGHGIVSLSVRYSGWAASPYMRVQSFNFLTGGGELQATDIFLPGTAEKLVDLLQATRDAAIAEARIGLNEEELQTFDSMLTGPGASNQSISARHFEQFVVTGQGLRFYYYFAFPVEHQAMSPSGDYLIPYADLRPYIDPGGPLGWARRKK